MDILKLELLFTQKFKIIKQIKTPYKVFHKCFLKKDFFGVFMFFLPHLLALESHWFGSVCALLHLKFPRNKI